MLDASRASGDDGSLEFFTREPQELFASLGEPARASRAAAFEGGAAGVGDGGAAGVRDLFDGVQAAARRLADFTTHYEMKQRAGPPTRRFPNRALRARPPQWLICQGRLPANPFIAPAAPGARRAAPPPQQPHPGRWRLRYCARFCGACALRSLAACARRAASGSAASMAAPTAPRGEGAPHAVHGHGSLRASSRRNAENAPCAGHSYS